MGTALCSSRETRPTANRRSFWFSAFSCELSAMGRRWALGALDRRGLVMEARLEVSQSSFDFSFQLSAFGFRLSAFGFEL